MLSPPVTLSTTPSDGSSDQQHFESETTPLASNPPTTTRAMPRSTFRKTILTTTKIAGNYPSYKGQAVTHRQQIQSKTSTFIDPKLATQLPEITNDLGLVSDQPKGTMAPTITSERPLSTVTSHTSEQQVKRREGGKRSGSNGEGETKADSRKTIRGRKRKTTRGHKSDNKTSQARRGSHGHGRHYGTVRLSHGCGRGGHSAKPSSNRRQSPYGKKSGSATNRFRPTYVSGGKSGKSNLKATSKATSGRFSTSSSSCSRVFKFAVPRFELRPFQTKMSPS
ncbi:hypothetical protein Bbelb_149410 [Branchiostoma belcheri]|nr:hypothetical protein Bbelb_149410 [Branchiostoma belcheri]